MPLSHNKSLILRNKAKKWAKTVYLPSVFKGVGEIVDFVEKDIVKGKMQDEVIMATWLSRGLDEKNIQAPHNALTIEGISKSFGSKVADLVQEVQIPENLVALRLQPLESLSTILPRGVYWYGLAGWIKGLTHPAQSIALAILALERPELTTGEKIPFWQLTGTHRLAYQKHFAPLIQEKCRI